MKVKRRKALFDKAAQARAAANIRHMEAWRKPPETVYKQDVLEAAIFGSRRKGPNNTGGIV